MIRGIIAALFAKGVQSIFFAVSGFDPYEEFDSVLKYVVDFGSFVLLYIPADYLIGLLKIGRKRGVKKEPAELL